jgi:hypothetical protein
MAWDMLISAPMSKSTAKDLIGSAVVVVLTVSVILALLLAGAPF